MTQTQLLLIQEIIMKWISVLLKIQLTLKQKHLGSFLLCGKKSQDKKQKKVAMFCTGGIRCEKATS